LSWIPTITNMYQRHSVKAVKEKVMLKAKGPEPH